MGSSSLILWGFGDGSVDMKGCCKKGKRGLSIVAVYGGTSKEALRLQFFEREREKRSERSNRFPG